MAELTEFFESHGIFHSKEVIFEVGHYTVRSYRRDDEGKYILSQEHPGQPIEDVEVFTYGH
jgi:hypothetical protein